MSESSSVTTRFLGIPTSLDDLTMAVCVGGGLYFWLARGKKFGELGLASVSSVGFAFFAMKFNDILLRYNVVDPAMLVKGYKIIMLSVGFDSCRNWLWNQLNYKRDQ